MLDPPPEPLYLDLHRSGELARRAEEAVARLEECVGCPRECRVDRLHALAPRGRERDVIMARQLFRRVTKPELRPHVQKGTSCFTGRRARVSSAFPHHGEEDCLRGSRGSGTIFFAFCNLHCVFCQNYEISHGGEGAEVTAEELAALMLDLQARGCHNINLVTPGHVVAHVLEALVLAAERGLRLPLVYNTNAYDSARNLRLLEGVVDVYMPDFKLWKEESARSYLKAPDYPEVARRSVAEMHRQVGPLRFDSEGVAARGVLIRHLVMPGGLSEAESIFRFLADEVSPDTWVNVMGQYRPAGEVSGERHKKISRKTSWLEVKEAKELARRAGLWRFDERW